MSQPDIICIAGKNDIATACLKWLLESGWPREKTVVLCNLDDPGKHTWQYSLRCTAQLAGVREISLEEAEDLRDSLFLSLEFDRIIKPSRFRSGRLFNVHFSKLPEYRGVHTSIWPILDGCVESGVTLHRIDPGIDTGEIVDQRTFPLELEWTSRDLYEAYLHHGTELVLSNFRKLIQDSAQSSPQSAVGASYHGRGELDFDKPPLRARGTGYQVHNSLRAFAFWEYQLPCVEGRQVLRSSMSPEPSSARAGRFLADSEWTGRIATLDHDVCVLFNVYGPLFEWARTGGSPPSSGLLDCVTDWDRADANGWNALMMAAWSGRSEVVGKLLELGADPNWANKRGTTPLMYAASHAEESRDAASMQVLIERGARVDAVDCRNLTVLEHLNIRGSRTLARTLEKYSL